MMELVGGGCCWRGWHLDGELGTEASRLWVTGCSKPRLLQACRAERRKAPAGVTCALVHFGVRTRSLLQASQQAAREASVGLGRTCNCLGHQYHQRNWQTLTNYAVFLSCLPIGFPKTHNPPIHTTSMDSSLLELWHASSGTPFVPTIGKDNQFLVASTLLILALSLSGAFALSMHTTKPPPRPARNITR